VFDAYSALSWVPGNNPRRALRSPRADAADLPVFAYGNSYTERRAVVDRLALVLNRGLTVADAHRVLKAVAGERLYALYLLALCRGVRRGELP
jgi:hypothetical protein